MNKAESRGIIGLSRAYLSYLLPAMRALVTYGVVISLCTGSCYMVQKMSLIQRFGLIHPDTPSS